MPRAAPLRYRDGAGSSFFHSFVLRKANEIIAKLVSGHKGKVETRRREERRGDGGKKGIASEISGKVV